LIDDNYQSTSMAPLIELRHLRYFLAVAEASHLLEQQRLSTSLSPLSHSK